MPEGIGVLIAELLDAVADFGGGEGPDCLTADLSAGLVVYWGCCAVDEDLVGERGYSWSHQCLGPHALSCRKNSAAPLACPDD